jgi:hypothetical protein
MFAWPKTTDVLWLSPFLFEALIIGAMWIRKLYQELPVFFAYVLYHTFRSMVLYPIWRSHNLQIYAIAYLSGEVVSVGLGFAALYEVFQTVLRPYREIQRVGNWLFAWAAILATGVAVVSGIDHGHELEAAMAAFLTLERSVRLVQAGLLLFLFVFARSLGLTLRNCVLGVAIGFAFFVGTELAVVTWRLHAGVADYPIYALLTQLSYVCAQFIWVCYFLQPEPKFEIELASGRGVDLARWNQALAQFLYNQ